MEQTPHARYDEFADQFTSVLHDNWSDILQVINVHSYKDGKLHEVYYWCDVCTIRGYEAGICDCCGGPVERREVPVK